MKLNEQNAYFDLLTELIDKYRAIFSKNTICIYRKIEWEEVESFLFENGTDLIIQHNYITPSIFSDFLADLYKVMTEKKSLYKKLISSKGKCDLTVAVGDKKIISEIKSVRNCIQSQHDFDIEDRLDDYKDWITNHEISLKSEIEKEIKEKKLFLKPDTAYNFINEVLMHNIESYYFLDEKVLIGLFRKLIAQFFAGEKLFDVSLPLKKRRILFYMGEVKKYYLKMPAIQMPQMF